MVNRVRKAAESKYNILAENEVVLGNLRSDLVIVKNNKATIIDITVPFENRMDALNQARLLKLQKYEDLARALSGRFAEVKVDAIVLGSLESWDPENKVMRTMCSKKYLKLFKKLCVSDLIRYSRDIYVEHITGVRQQ
jgi:diphthamide synthase (EF-2-diphthine--ammonia ligase)